MEQKVIIVQPVVGVSSTERYDTYMKTKRIIEALQKGLGPMGFDIELISKDPSTLEIESGDAELEYLSQNLADMSRAQVVVFTPGYDKSRICRAMYDCATAYGKATVVLSKLI